VGAGLRPALVAVLLLAASCVRGDRAKQDEVDRKPTTTGVDPDPAPPQVVPPERPAQTAISVQTIEEAVAAKGQYARVSGTVQREKLGDTIRIGDLSVLCVGAEFPDEVVGKPGSAEGTLDVTERHQATVGPGGEVSAGTAPGTKRWVLEGCRPL
jgi:hypothetical protein